jgi:hypothetical protein
MLFLRYLTFLDGTDYNGNRANNTYTLISHYLYESHMPMNSEPFHTLSLQKETPRQRIVRTSGKGIRTVKEAICSSPFSASLYLA